MRKAKKTISAIFLAALMAVLLVAMTACGASGTLSGFVSAVKKMDSTKAATYVDGDWSGSSSDDVDEVTKYAYKKTVGSFSYKVVSSEETKDEETGEVTATVIKISYSAYSYAVLATKLGFSSFLSGTQKTKADVDTAIKDMEKVNGSTTVTITKDSEGAWKLSELEATALLAVMSMPISD
jgi:hypothetical protein